MGSIWHKILAVGHSWVTIGSVGVKVGRNLCLSGIGYMRSAWRCQLVHA